MSNIVISVENLSKSYRLGQIGTGTLSRDLEVWWAKVRGKPNPLLKIGQTDHGNQDGQTLWALKDVSFQVQQGEVLGIIGRNGAGKSTLLKILSRVTAPTSGQVKVKGRIASLLEVGTGFHPELTGRENIFLNGAILGMSKQEVQRKFDEIVSFAEIEKFVDTPVKRYSSGMYVRLAFAVAAHLESEILLVDEVLAVGDAEFQKKCLGKMGDVATKEGRTVFFVSHNMGSIRNLCEKCILLNYGKLDILEATETVIRKYLESNQNEQTGIWLKNNQLDSDINIIEISSRTISNQVNGNLDSQKNFKIRIRVNSKITYNNAQIHIRITNQEGISIFTLSNSDDQSHKYELVAGNSTYEVTIPGNFLKPGKYNAIVAILEPNIRILDLVENFNFKIVDVGNHGTILRDGRLGVVTPIFEWERTVE